MFYIFIILYSVLCLGMVIFAIKSMKNSEKIKVNSEDFEVIEVKKNSSDIEFLIRKFLWKSRKNSCENYLVLQVLSWDEDVKKICEIYSKKYDFIKIDTSKLNT